MPSGPSDLGSSLYHLNEPQPFARAIWPITHWGTDRRQVIAPGDHRAAPPSITRTPEAVRQPNDQPGEHLPPGGAPRHRPGRTEDTGPRFPDQRVHTLEIIRGTSNTLRGSRRHRRPHTQKLSAKKAGRGAGSFSSSGLRLRPFPSRPYGPDHRNGRHTDGLCDLQAV